MKAEMAWDRFLEGHKTKKKNHKANLNPFMINVSCNEDFFKGS